MKFSKNLLLAFLLCLGSLLFHSCSEDWDKWETISAEIDASALQGAEIPYEGDKKMISIKTNSNWEITGNEWITFNKTSGIGDDVVEVSILGNSTEKKRNGKVEVKIGKKEPDTNIVGMKTETISFIQHSLAVDIQEGVDMKIVSIKGTRSKELVSHEGKYEYLYTLEITYNIQVNSLSLEKLLQKAIFGVSWSPSEGNYFVTNIVDEELKVGTNKTVSTTAYCSDNVINISIYPSIIANERELTYEKASGLFYGDGKFN